MPSGSLAFYAHKGGVGKSTLIFDVAKNLLRLYPRLHVYIVDADTQLNLTFKVLKNLGITITDELIASLLTQDENAHVNVSINDQVHQKATLYTYISGMQHAYQRRDLIQVTERCFFLLGSPILHKLELQLINAILNPGNNPATRHVPLLFHTLLTALKTDVNSVVLVDMSPSTNYLNQCLLLSCDKFVIPCNADDNSLVSLSLLFNYIGQWRNIHNYLPANHFVKLAFVVLNRYKIESLQQHTLTGINQRYLNRIITYVQNFLALPNNGFIEEGHGATANDIVLKLQNGFRFMELCSEQSLSIVDLTSAICTQYSCSWDPAKVDSLLEELALITSRIRRIFNIQQ